MKPFISANWLMLFSLSFGSSLSHAVIIDVDYEGEVYEIEGNGLGYSVGERIFGSLYINTNLAPDDNNPSEPTRGSYYLWDSVGGFVTGYAPNDTEHFDSINIYDQFRGKEYFAVYDGSGTYNDDGQGTYSGNFTEVSLYALSRTPKGGTSPIDFISGDGLEQAFSLTDADQLSTFEGQFYNGLYEYVDYQEVYDIWNTASFNLTSLSVMTHVDSPPACTQCTGIAADIPEPTTIALFGLGLAGLGFARRRKV